MTLFTHAGKAIAVITYSVLLAISSSSAIAKTLIDDTRLQALKPPIVVIDPGKIIFLKPLKTVYVQKWGRDTGACGSKTSPCQSINHGLLRVAATTTPYDTASLNSVYVGPGRYRENVVINKTGIKVVSLFGTDMTIIAASDSSDNTVSITADGVQFGAKDKGFTLMGSNLSGLFSTGSNVGVEGNRAVGNGRRGFELGDATVNITQSNITVKNNEAEFNGIGGFYFTDISKAQVIGNVARNNMRNGGGFMATGSGFWFDSRCSDFTITRNRATENEAMGFFWRRFGITDHVINNNQAALNLSHGFMFMGDRISINDNTAVNNEGDGFHFMGYDHVQHFTYNTAVENTRAGIMFDIEVLPGATVVDVISHNNIINNDSIRASGNNCGLLNNFQDKGFDTVHDNFWGNPAVPGPGADPADDVCGFLTEDSAPAATMNTRYFIYPLPPVLITEPLATVFDFSEYMDAMITP